MTALVLSPAQYAMLLQELPAFRVRQLRGQSHLEAWDVRRTLIRIFGFGGWDLETRELTLVAQLEHPPSQDGGKPRWTVVYRAQARLLIKNPDGSVGAFFDDGASGDSQNQPSLGDAHDQAMKTALSQALKRCAVNLGDQFGMSLYNDGMTKAVVLRTLAGPDVGEPAPVSMPHDETPVQGEPEPAHHEPEPEPAYETEKVGQDQHRRMHALWNELGYSGDVNRATRLALTAKLLGLPDLGSSADLTRSQADVVITALKKRKRDMAKPAEVTA